jgi:glycine/sarcosine/betaine reductase complex component A
VSKPRPTRDDDRMRQEPWREVNRMLDLRDKLVLALGERDGIPAPALRACIEGAGGRVIYEVTQCFV